MIQQKKKALEILQQISDILIVQEHPFNHGLLHGNGGILLFFANYYRFFKQEQVIADKIDKLVTSIFSSNVSRYNNFGTGYSGFVWLLDYLVDVELLESNFLRSSNADMSNYYRAIADDIMSTDYDFFYGFLGKTDTLDNSQKGSVNNLVKSWIDRNTVRNDEYNYFLYEKDTINLGFAHGIANVGLALYNQGYIDKEFLDKLCGLYRHIFFIRHNNPISIFPNAINLQNMKENTLEVSRLAWCYGDLGILYFLSAIDSLGNFDHRVLINALVDSCNKRTLSNSFVVYSEEHKYYDVGFCHGISGIFHLLERIKLLKPDIGVTVNSYWLDALLENLNILLPLVKDNLIKSEYSEEAYSLLSGISGAGLVLQSYLSQEYQWDYCLTLNKFRC